MLLHHKICFPFAKVKSSFFYFCKICYKEADRSCKRQCFSLGMWLNTIYLALPFPFWRVSHLRWWRLVSQWSHEFIKTAFFKILNFPQFSVFLSWTFYAGHPYMQVIIQKDCISHWKSFHKEPFNGTGLCEGGCVRVALWG